MLMMMPRAATIIMVSGSMTKSWLITLSTAKYTNTPVRIQIMNILDKAPKISVSIRVD
jgi:Ni,Fe-hydrogenase III small subunit